MISHDEARALISARLDRQLDPASEQQLAQHLHGCASCRRFAAQMTVMQTGIRELPYLPPSPVVRRAVMTEVRKGRTVGGRLSAWLGQFGLSTGPLATIGATAVLVLVVVATLLTSSVLDRDPGDGAPSGTEVALQGASETTRAAATVAQAGTDRTASQAPAAGPPSPSPVNVPGSGAGASPPPLRANLTIEEQATADAETAVAGAPATDAPPIEPTATADDAAEIALLPPTPTTAPSTAAEATQASTDAAETVPAETGATETVAPAPSTDPTATQEPDEVIAALIRPATSTATPSAEASATTTATREATATPTEEPTATAQPTATPMAQPAATAEPTATPTQEPTATQTAEPTATPTEEPTATPTEEPTATPTEEPTAAPTDEPTPATRGGINPTDNNTPIPADDTEPTVPADDAETQGQDPTSDGQPTEGADSTGTAIETATATPTETPSQTPTATATRGSRGGINPTDNNTPVPVDQDPPTVDVIEPTATVPADDEADGTGDDQVILPQDDSGSGSEDDGEDVDSDGNGEDGTTDDGSTEVVTPDGFSIDSAPVTTGVSLGAAPPGPLRVSSDGSQFLVSDGGDTIGVAGFGGGETILGTLFYPTWTGQGQILVTYYPDDSGGAAIGLISPAGGISAVTTPDPADPGRRDVAAGEIGGALYYQRDWPAEPERGIELHWVSGGNDEVIWSDPGLVPVGRHPNLTPGGTFLIATSGGWYQVDGNGGASALGGNVAGEPVGIAFGPGDAVAVLGGGQLALGTVGNPGGGVVIGGVGDGAGVAWSPDGSEVAVASGSVVSIYDTGGNVLRTFTSDAGAPLSGLLWSGGDLLVVRGGGSPGLIAIPAGELP